MRKQRGRVGLMAAALVGLAVVGAQAQVTTEKSASILVFPKVIANGTRDTVIQITNTSNSMVHAHCFYVNGALTFPEFPPGPQNPPLWIETDFDIWLTKQQPTHWVVSQGRLVNAADQPCTNLATASGAQSGGIFPGTPSGFYGCNDAGLDPGRVPPVVDYFTGELKCIEVDPSGAPLSGNHLKGEATTTTFNVCDPKDPRDPSDNRCVLQTIDEACTSDADCDESVIDVAKYNAIGVLGNENNDGDNVLCLGGEPSEECMNGAEYDACPQVWIANHFAEGAPNPTTDGSVETTWTIVPCTQNFEEQTPETVTLVINVWNEFETAFSAGTRVTCWDQLSLSQVDPVVFGYSALGTSFAQSRLRSSAATASGFMMVQSEAYSTDDDDGIIATADVNLHVEGERAGPDLITIPPDQIQ